MPIGKKSGQAGNAVPLTGESEIRQESSGIDVLTITMASGVSATTAGKPLVIRSYHEVHDANSTGGEVFSVDALGNLKLADGAGVTMGASASFHNPVWTTVDIAAGDSYTVLASNAGKLHIYAGPSTGNGVLTLPKASGLAMGTQFFFYMAGAAIASGTRISSSLSSSDDIIAPATNMTNSTNKVIQVSATGLELGAALRLTKVAAKRWWATDMNAMSTVGGWKVVGP